MVLAASLITGALGAERSVVDISLGWRHHLGPYTVSGSANPSPTRDRNLAGL